MKAIMVMYDSLNRHMLPPYGCDWVIASNFQRLARRSATFDNCYVGSMPCMPARRELHTGRYNFLHRSWGPLEPFDDSMPRILKTNDVHTHLISDHYHYWEDGGCTYHPRYSTWEISRGQEGDPWKADVGRTTKAPNSLNPHKGKWGYQDWVNRSYAKDEADYPQSKTFRMAEEFLHANHQADNWWLHVETFDPHEPYQVPLKYQQMYQMKHPGEYFDWPTYTKIWEDPKLTDHLRLVNAALISMCDANLGKILDLMDQYDLWKDTMLIVNTDHGFLLGEHGWWGKMAMPHWQEIAHTPLFVWDPRSSVAGQRRNSLVQMIDLPATLLEYFGVDRPGDMQGSPLRQTVADDTPVRQAGLFGAFGQQVNVTDGRYVYMRGPATEMNSPLFEYTHMPTHMRGAFRVEELQDISLAEPFSFTKGCRTMKIPVGNTKGPTKRPNRCPDHMRNLLYDVQNDPAQQHPLEDAKAEKTMIDHLVDLMHHNDAPPEQFERLGLNS